MTALLKRNRLLALCVGFSCAPALIAAPADQQQDLAETQWYIGAGLGLAKGEVDASQMNQRMAEQGYDTQADVQHLSRESYSLMAGYHLFRNLALEAGYTDLGKVETTLKGSAADINDFLQSADRVHPASAEGYELNLYGRYPFNERLDVFARAGLMFSTSDYHAKATSGEWDQREDDKRLPVFGIGLDYGLNEHWLLRGSASSYKFDDENVSVLGVGLLYRFLREPEQKPLVTTVSPAAPSPSPVVVLPPPVIAPPTMLETLRGQGFAVQHGDRGLVAELGGVLFATNSAQLTPEGRAAVLKMAAALKAYPTRNVAVEGHTDNQGRAAKNERLSLERANAVRQALVTAGIAPQRMVARGYGANYPVASNQDAAGRQLNRRVEFIIADQEGGLVPARTK